MNKILIVETNVKIYENNNIPTGLWLGELTEFYDEINKYGFEADFVSPKGGFVPIDPVSIKFAKKTDFKWYNDFKFKHRAILNTKNPSQINPDDYVAIYYTGGHGVLWDFPNNKSIQSIAENIYNNNGYITAVCHGVVGLLNLKDRDGKYLIDGKKVTGFTNTEEFLSGRFKKVPFLTENALKRRKANYCKRRFFSSFAVEDSRIITGQNPFSPRKVARLLIKNLRGEI